MALYRDRAGKIRTRFYYYDATGKRQRFSKTLGDISTKAAKVAEAQLIAKYKVAKPVEGATFTVEQAIEAYLKLRGPSLAGSTIYIVEQCYKDRWLEGFGKDTDCLSITNAHIQKYLNVRSAETSKTTGKVLSKSSIYREFDLLRSVFSHCAEWGYIKYSSNFKNEPTPGPTPLAIVSRKD